MTPNQVTRRIGKLVLIRENAETPRDEEWDETLRLLTVSPQEVESLKVLVVTDGGGPTPEQRKRLNLLEHRGSGVEPVGFSPERFAARFVGAQIGIPIRVHRSAETLLGAVIHGWNALQREEQCDREGNLIAERGRMLNPFLLIVIIEKADEEASRFTVGAQEFGFLEFAV